MCNLQFSSSAHWILRIVCVVALLAVVCPSLLSAADDPEAAKKRELEKLQGVWKVKSFTSDGKEEATDRFVWTITRHSIAIKYDTRDDIWFFGSDTGVLDYTLELDKGRTVLKTKVASPGNIGVTRTELYRLDGNTLTVVYNEDEDMKDAIPESLDAKKGSGRHLTTLTRIRQPQKK